MTIARKPLPIVTNATATGRNAVTLVFIGTVLTALNACTHDDAAAIDTAAGVIAVATTHALWQRASYFHDGSARTLAAVVDRYNRALSRRLSAEDQRRLVEYLKSI